MKGLLGRVLGVMEKSDVGKGCRIAGRDGVEGKGHVKVLFKDMLE